ncbi:MAG: rhomboid family intramembrane serine protease [Pirellulales bacterium]|nr:rhomboid family intramembrane serine protease [Pirellulales bacterium]
MLFPFHDDNPTERTPVVTYALIALNALAFLWMQRLPPSQRQILAYQRGFVPARIASLVRHRPIQIEIRQAVPHPLHGFPVVRKRAVQLEPVPRQVFASLFTCMFLHGGWLHLIGNMWFLWVFGNNVEDRLGPVPFAILYLTGGLLASTSHWIVGPGSMTPVIGASGAVATVLGAYAVTWPWARVHTLVFLFVFITIIDLPALFVLGLWFVYQLLAGQDALQQQAAGGVAWWAHVGGFVAGFLLMPLFSAVVGAGPPTTHHKPPTDDELW